MQDLAWRLGVPLSELRRLAQDPDHTQYRPFVQRKPGKKPRNIDNPKTDIKIVQRRIRQILLEQLRLPDWMHGCVKGKSAHSNATVHKNQPNLAKVDVKRFFPTVTYRMVYAIFVRAGFGAEPARLLTRLATRSGHLPQGAPTSDRLANLHLATAAPALEAIFEALDLEHLSALTLIRNPSDRSARILPFTK